MTTGDPRIGLLFSGGLDSTILLGHLLNEGYVVYPLYIRFYLLWEDVELRAARRIVDKLAQPRLAPLVILEVPVADLYGDHWSLNGQGIPDAFSRAESVFLPGRNALLALKAGLWCQLHRVPELALGVLCTNPFSDATEEFFTEMERVLVRSLGHPLRFVRPFGHLDKAAVMDLGRNLPLELSFSCIFPIDGNHCGGCNKCAERHEAFVGLNLPDPTIYVRPLASPEPRSL